MKFHYLVRAIIHNDYNTFLLVREKGGRYTFLPGGHIEFSESARSALRRELLEETGVDFKIGEFIGAIEHTWYEANKLNAEINLIFPAYTRQMDDVSSKEPHLEFIWVKKEDIHRMNLKPEPLVDLLTNNIKNKSNSYWASTIENGKDLL